MSVVSQNLPAWKIVWNPQTLMLGLEKLALVRLEFVHQIVSPVSQTILVGSRDATQ